MQRYHSGELRAENFVAELGVLYHSSLRGLRGKLFFMVQFPHKCMYDTPALIGALSSTGFDTRSRGPLESDIPQIEEIEIPSRTEEAVIVEGTKR